MADIIEDEPESKKQHVNAMENTRKKYWLFFKDGLAHNRQICHRVKDAS